ncbi:MAG: isoprenylcysteine carboxylmethyltransferase family protein [Candidatus Dormibacteraeota bacterium]|uniref:Isoprenylcysteine carboxylmethyltransferase family protein n=1 Tax=Candidatus Amunia macphersoniae TaxID=3127014 RepID=A0A934KIV1_9BACT|nr:isoprenylcysteine carboxylmethyltransferase family protein [Candidatus Dormibacteraeota bacterium]
MASLGLVAGWALQIRSLVGGAGSMQRRSTRTRLAAAALIATSTAGAVLAHHSLGPAWRTSVSGTGSAPLATAGPYRLVRHPVYTAMLGVLLGNVIVARTQRAIVGFGLGVAALELQARVVEEPALKVAYSDRYAGYSAATGRFLPVIGRRRQGRGLR